jgi:hypothetical protein
MVKRKNESDHRLIRYLISLPLDADVTNPEVLNEYSEVLKKVNIDIKDSALDHIKLDIDDILRDGGGHFAMIKKLQSVLKKFNSDELNIPTNLASDLLNQGAVTSIIVLDVCRVIENPGKFDEFFQRCNNLCMKRVEGALAKRHGSREIVTHVTSVRELYRLVSKEISESFPDVNKAHELIPSYDYLLKQFTPKNQYCIKSDRYFSKLPFQLTLSGRSYHVKHIDFEYTQTVKNI